MQAIEVFTQLVPLFQKAGFQLYMVGGSARDYVLHRAFQDLDLATDATPEEVKVIFPEANDRFAQFGNVHFVIDEVTVDVTTMRKESHYRDARHPSQIIFVDAIEIDAKRRDFTMNALYVDAQFLIHDFYGGQKDIENKMIRMIGDPMIRFKEDPLRILRAIRFAIDLGFTLDSHLEEALVASTKYLMHLNPAKVHQEVKKIKKIDGKIAQTYFDKYHIHLD